MYHSINVFRNVLFIFLHQKDNCFNCVVLNKVLTMYKNVQKQQLNRVHQGALLLNIYWLRGSIGRVII